MRFYVVLFVFAVVACVTNEFSGERQFLLTSEAEEIALGEEAYLEMTGPGSGLRTIEDPAWYGSLQRVGNAIATAADKPEFNWEFKLIDDAQTVNAWCLPGGKIAFYTGIYPILQDEAGMAIVMGHEVCHALLRHGGERISSQMLAQGLSGVAQISLQDSENGGMYMAALGAVTALGSLRYGRGQETAADYHGLMLAAKAGYDPRVAIDIWTRMGELSGGGGLEFLSTHPNPGTRVENMREWMPEALQLWEQSNKKESRPLPTNAGG